MLVWGSGLVDMGLVELGVDGLLYLVMCNGYKSMVLYW